MHASISCQVHWRNSSLMQNEVGWTTSPGVLLLCFRDGPHPSMPSTNGALPHHSVADDDLQATPAAGGGEVVKDHRHLGPGATCAANGDVPWKKPQQSVRYPNRKHSMLGSLIKWLNMCIHVCIDIAPFLFLHCSYLSWHLGINIDLTEFQPTFNPHHPPGPHLHHVPRTQRCRTTIRRGCPVASSTGARALARFSGLGHPPAPATAVCR